MPRRLADRVRAYFEAYRDNDQDAVARALAPDFRFYSPPDPGLDRAAYLERCWPNTRIAAFELKRLIELGDEVVATYEAQTTEGARFRNTEVFTFEGERLKQVEVYFGWNL